MKSDRRAHFSSAFSPSTIFLSALFLAAALACICIIWQRYRHTDSENVLAEVYQDGTLIYAWRLDQVEEPFTVTVTSGDGGCNLIEVRPGAVGILSADCPDQICVSQGFLTDSMLPITCLPHRLVILLREP